MSSVIHESKASPTAPDPARVDVITRTQGDDAARRRRWKRIEQILYMASPIVFLIVWQVASMNDLLDSRFFPPPTDVFDELTDMVASGELWDHLWISSKRILTGFVLGAVPAVILGLAMGMLPIVRAIFKPLVDAIFPVPKIALLPLFIMLLGVGETSKYAIIATAVFFLVLINTASGVKNIDRIYFDIATNYGSNRWLTFRTIALPGAMPSVVAGLRIGFSIALLVIVAAEFVGAEAGMGYLIWTSWQLFRIERMYVGLVVIAVLGLGSAALLDWVERKIVPWKPPPS